MTDTCSCATADPLSVAKCGLTESFVSKAGEGGGVLSAKLQSLSSVYCHAAHCYPAGHPYVLVVSVVAAGLAGGSRSGSRKQQTGMSCWRKQSWGGR